MIIRRVLRSAWLRAALFLTFIVTVLAHQTDSATADQDPIGKSALIQAAVGSNDALVNIESAELLDAFGDSGSADMIATIKAELPDLLTADRSISRMPLNFAARAPYVTGYTEPEPVTGAKSRLEEELSHVWWGSLLPHAFHELVQNNKDALQEASVDPSYRAFVDNDFIVQEWQGVRVEGTEAFALLIGHDAYFDTSWENDVDRQWQVGLRQIADDNGVRVWRLNSQASLDLEVPATDTILTRE